MRLAVFPDGPARQPTRTRSEQLTALSRAEVVTVAERAFLSDPQLVVALEKVNASPELRSQRKRRPLATIAPL